MVTKIIVDEETFGITVKSLKMLRNELARRIEHSIRVYQIRTSELCCGFLILDFTNLEAVWSGDGFRTDNGGEGGAGYRSAVALLKIYGIIPQEYAGISPEACRKEDVIKALEEHPVLADWPMDIPKLSDYKPIYLR